MPRGAGRASADDLSQAKKRLAEQAGELADLTRERATPVLIYCVEIPASLWEVALADLMSSSRIADCNLSSCFRCIGWRLISASVEIAADTVIQ